jgi:hypothetical protein
MTLPVVVECNVSDILIYSGIIEYQLYGSNKR